MLRSYVFRLGLCVTALAMLTASCGGSSDDPNQAGIQLQQKTNLPLVDGTPFLVKTTPPDMRRLDANLENKAMLLGYTINTDTASPGQTLVVTWFWKSMKPIEGNWEFFTHLVNEDGERLHSSNSQGPMRSKYKPQMWKPGEILQDVEQITIPQTWKSKMLEMRTGLWQGPDRLRVVKGPVDEENRIKGPVVTIVAEIPRPVLRSTASAEIPFSAKAPVIDGKLEDKIWAAAKTLEPFVDSVKGTPMPSKTEVRLLWDSKNLYVAMTGDDTQLTSPYTQNDEDLWRADAFDIFLQPSESSAYYEIQVSPTGLVFDAAYGEYRKADVAWSSDIKLAVKPEGTVNDDTSPDTSWTLEAAIPLSKFFPADAAASEQTLSANFFRINASAQGTEYASWSAPMRGDFHAQDRFGKLILKK